MTDFEFVALIIIILMYAFSEAFRIVAFTPIVSILAVGLALQHQDETIFLWAMISLALMSAARGWQMLQGQNGVNSDE